MLTSEEGGAAGALKLISALDVRDIEVGDVVEQMLTSESISSPESRIIAYEVLSYLDRALPSKFLEADGSVKALHPLRWLDLVLPTIYDSRRRQSLIEDLIKNGSFPVELMWPRLTSLWRAGGNAPAIWFDRLSHIVPRDDLSAFNELTRAAFSDLGFESQSAVAVASKRSSWMRGPNLARRAGSASRQDQIRQFARDSRKSRAQPQFA